MISVGIDVAKDKHDCFIISSEGEILKDVFTISNDIKGFTILLEVIKECSSSQEKIKVGLEATGHYSYNILRFLNANDLPVYVLNPLSTSQFRKSRSLRKTKTDKIDARNIATMLLSDVDLQPYHNIEYHNDELKSLTRYLFLQIKERAKLKQRLSRLVTIIFPELEHIVSSIHNAYVYAVLREYSSIKAISRAHLNHLSSIIEKASRGRHSEEKAIELREAAKKSIGSSNLTNSMELRHIFSLFDIIEEQIKETENSIEDIMSQVDSPILTIPGIGIRTAAMIIGEIGEFAKFNTPDKILAFAGIAPSTSTSGYRTKSYGHMEKRGSIYLRYALFSAARNVCLYNEKFKTYLAKKRAEGKHYSVAMSHVAKKLVRVIFSLQKTGAIYEI